MSLAGGQLVQLQRGLRPGHAQSGDQLFRWARQVLIFGFYGDLYGFYGDLYGFYGDTMGIFFWILWEFYRDFFTMNPFYMDFYRGSTGI